MQPIGDGSLKGGLLSESDLSAYFENLWNELDELEEYVSNSDNTRGNVRLDCNGELVDIASIGSTVVRSTKSGAELIEFVCPRCDRLHESLRFGSTVSVMDKR